LGILMKKLLILLAIILLPSAFGACDKAATSTGGPPPSAPATGASGGAPAGGESKSPVTPPLALSGVYTISEVEDKGVVKMWPPDNKIEFIFSPDGTYARKSMLRGRLDHSDMGQYRLEGGKQLILSIVYSDNKAQIPAKEVRHAVALSPDGDSLKMTSRDGKSAIFKKTGDAPKN